VKVGVARIITGGLVASTAGGVNESGGGLNSTAQARVARVRIKNSTNKGFIGFSPRG
jgi:hypothetical protein